MPPVDGLAFRRVLHAGRFGGTERIPNQLVLREKNDKHRKESDRFHRLHRQAGLLLGGKSIPEPERPDPEPRHEQGHVDEPV